MTFTHIAETLLEVMYVFVKTDLKATESNAKVLFYIQLTLNFLRLQLKLKIVIGDVNLLFAG